MNEHSEEIDNEFNEEINKLFTNLYKTTCNYFTSAIKEKKDRNYEPTDVLLLALAKISIFSLTCGNDYDAIKKATEIYFKQIQMNVDMCLLDLENNKH